MDHWGIWDWTKFICCNRPLEITSDAALKQRPFYESDIAGYTAQEIHEQHQRFHHLIQQHSQHHHQQQQQQDDDVDQQCMHDTTNHGRSVIGYNLYEDNNYRSSTTLLGLNSQNDYERLKTSLSGRNISSGQDIDCQSTVTHHHQQLSNNNSLSSSNNNNINNIAHSQRTSSKLLDNQLITMDGLRNQLVRRKSGAVLGTSSALRPPTVERCDELQVTLRGWLYRLEGGAIKQWKRRWFVLGDYCLFYYKDANEEKCHGSVLLPSYRVSLCRSSEDGITRKYSFKLEHQNMKTYFLAADSKESMDQWMNALGLASIMQLNYGSNGGSSGQSGHSYRSVPDGGLVSRNQPDGQDLTDSRMISMLSTGSMSKNGDEEEDSGFNSYKPRRPPMPNSTVTDGSSAYLSSGAKYPGSYNCIGLPPISFHGQYFAHPSSAAAAAAASSAGLIYPHQKRSHYANAPPKPRRQQLGETGLDMSDIYPSTTATATAATTNNDFALPPGAHYNHSYYGPGNGPAPDLIAHNNNSNGNPNNASNNIVNSNGNNINNSNNPNGNNSNSNISINNATNNNYFQGSSHPIHPFNVNYTGTQPNGLKLQYPISSPLSPSSSNVNPHYSIPPPSQFTANNQQQQQQSQQQYQQQTPVQAGQPYNRTRLPPRPHSADFLDREAQDEDEMVEIENGYQHDGSASTTHNMSAGNGTGSYYQGRSTSRPDGDYSGNGPQSIQPPKILPIRPKSSLDRYDPYYYKNQIDYGTSNSGSTVNHNNTTNSGGTIGNSHLTSPPPRPWSDYLQQQAARQNQMPVSPTVSSSTSLSNSVTANRTNSKPLYPPSNLDMSPRGQQDREASLLRLLEWKQKMLSGPFNKRNSGAKGQSKSPSHLQGLDMTADIPMRPPLPKEYRTKIGLSDSRSGETSIMQERQSREEPIFSRERSKSIGSSFPINDITYSSDDEGAGLKSPSSTMAMMGVETPNRSGRCRHESCGNPLTSDNSNGPIEGGVGRACSPDYMNINHLYSIPVKMNPNSNLKPVTATTITTTSGAMITSGQPVGNVNQADSPSSSDLPSMLASPRSGGDGQESEDNRDAFIKREDYYKAPSTLRHPHYQQTSDTYNQHLNPYQSQPTVMMAMPIIATPYEPQSPPPIMSYTTSSVSTVPNHLQSDHMIQPSSSTLASTAGYLRSPTYSTGYTNEDWDTVGLPKPDEQQIARCLSRSGLRAVSPPNLAYRPASCLPINGTCVTSVTNLSPFTSKVLPPPPPPKPQPKNILAVKPPSSLTAPNDNESRLLDAFHSNEPKPAFSDSKNNLITATAPLTASNNNGLSTTPDINREPLEPLKPEEASAPPPNFVKERIKSLEAKASKEDSINLSSSSTSTGPKDEKQSPQNKMPSGVSSDSEIGKANSITTDEEALTSKSAPITYSPLSSVLADLRKTAESRKEKLFAVEQGNPMNLSGREAGDGSPGLREPISKFNMTCDETRFSSYRSPINSAKTDKSTNDSAMLDSLRACKPNAARLVSTSAASFDDFDDKGEEADDEMSRDFDSLQYQSELTRNSLIPQSAKQLQSMRSTEKRIIFASDVACSVDQQQRMQAETIRLQPVPELVMDSCSPYSTSMDNPAYVSSSYLESAREETISESEPQTKVDDEELRPPTDKNDADDDSNKVAPYYYSDLLNGEDEGSQLPCGLRDREKSSRLQRSPQYSDKNQPNATGKKRCLTPEVTLDTSAKSFIRDNSGLRSSLRLDYSRSEKRRSKSLENLDDDHLYENLEFLKDNLTMKQDHDKPELPEKKKNKQKQLVTPAEDNLPSYAEVRKTVKFEETKNRTKNVDGKSESNEMQSADSDCSTIEGEGSQSGPFLDKKLRKRRSPRNRRSQDDLKNVSDSETTSKPPPPPPLPLGYNQYGYPYYNMSDNQPLKMQRKLSRSVGTGLQNEMDMYNSKIFSSAGELLGKTHEELVLLLIQLRRNQSHLAQTCDQLRLQMESEEKMIEIEPQRREEHKSRFKELRESLMEAERQYESQFPVIDMVDNMVKLNHPGPGTGMRLRDQQQQQSPPQNNTNGLDDFDAKRAKAASTSYLDRFPDNSPPPNVPQRSEQLKFTNYLSAPKKKTQQETEAEAAAAAVAAAADEAESAEQEKLFQYLQQDKDILEKTLEGVRSSLTNLSLNGGDIDSPTTSSNIEKMKQQQQMLEGELGRVRGLIVQSAKRLEQRATENAWIEQDVLMARSRLDQVLSSSSTASSTSRSAATASDPSLLEAELANIDQAIDNLHAKRKEILENFKKQKYPDPNLIVRGSPTGSSSLSDQNKRQQTEAVGGSNYPESSDLDSIESRDITPFNYLQGGYQITTTASSTAPITTTLTTEEDAESAHLYENLDKNLVKYGYTLGASNGIRSDQTYDNGQHRNTSDENESDRNEREKQETLTDYGDMYGYDESERENQQYTFQQPLLASNKTVRLVKRESERRRITSKITAYTGYSGQDPDPESSYNNLYSQGEFDGISHRNEDKDFYSEDNYSSNKRPSSLSLNHSTVKPDERKEIDQDDTSSASLRSSLSLPNSANDIPGMMLGSNYSEDKDDLGLDKINNQDHLRPATSTSGYLSNASSTWRSTDDSDMEQSRRQTPSSSFSAPSHLATLAPNQTTSQRSNMITPDIMTNSQNIEHDYFNDERIAREIGLPKKIEIPQRYIPETENTQLTSEEQTKRNMKAESFRKMLSEAAYGTFTPIHRRNPSNSSSCSVGGLPSSSATLTASETSDLLDFANNINNSPPLRKICSSGDIENLDSSSKQVTVDDVKNLFGQEKKRRAELLALNSEIAKEVTEKSRKVANKSHGTHSPSSFI